MSGPVSYPAGAVVVHVHGSWPDAGTPPPAASSGKDLRADALAPDRGRPFDAHAFRRVFVDSWAPLMRVHFRSDEEMAVFFDVTLRTIENWLGGVSRPTGDKVAMSAIAFPDTFRKLAEAA